MSELENPVDMYEASINSQYGQPNLTTELLAALERAGKNLDALTRDDLAPFEEIHIRGREGTRDLARLVDLEKDTSVLDLGSGIGGPARTLASEFGCLVTGLDLTENYSRAAEKLTSLVGLTDRVAIRQGNALNMSFDDESFDVVWLQHMAMNIKDKGRLVREIKRVLRVDGRLALHEILSGSVTPPHFPVPWADDPSVSHLVTTTDLRRLLTRAGFKKVAWLDDTEACIKWYQALFASRTPGAPPPIGLDLVLGSNFPEKGSNVLRNLEENRIVVIQAVYAGDQV